MSNILIVGDAMLDHYIVGQCARISPEAPVPVVNITSEDWRLGGAANVANNVAALGVNCTLISACGMDQHAQTFDILLNERKSINNKVCKINGRESIVKSRVLVGSHQMIRLDRETVSHLTSEEEVLIIETFLSQAGKADLILVSDYCKGVLSKNILKVIFQASKDFNIPTVVDPKSIDFSVYKGVSFVKPNRREAELASGIKIFDRTSLKKASEVIKKVTGAEAVITTLSEDGVGLFIRSELFIIPTKAKKVFDVTGAGDTYLAAFACEYLRSNDVFMACEFANLAAAVVIAKVGSSTASIEEIAGIRNESVVYEA